MKIDRIKSNLQIHDRYNLEIKVSYLLDRTRRSSAYQVESYLFLPTNLGVDDSSYPRSAFYQDLQNYVRFKTPSIPLDKLDQADEDSPYGKLCAASAALRSQPSDEEAVQNFEHEVKMFGAIVRGALRDFVVFFRDSSTTPEDRDRLIRSFVGDCRALLDRLKEHWGEIGRPGLSLDSQQDFLYMDEAVRLSIDENTVRLHQLLAEKSSGSPGTGGEAGEEGRAVGGDEAGDNRELATLLLDLLRFDQEERRRNHGKLPPSRDSSNEEFVFRKRILKKFLSSVLFLEVMRRPERRALQHVFEALVAGLSMTFTVLVAYYFNQHYEAFSIPVMAAAILAYMFKDRIKAVGQSLFRGMLDRRSFDHRISIFLPHHHQRIGYCQEYVRYLRERDLPERVAMLRNQRDFQQLERELIGESILLYRKRIVLHSRPIERLYPDTWGVNDILRINVRRWLGKMDNARVPLQVLEGDELVPVRGRKVYVLHLITRFTAADSEEFAVFRILIDQKGLRRIEEIPLTVNGSA